MRVGSEAAVGSGLLMDSVIMTDNLATVRDSEIDGAIGVYLQQDAIDAALRVTLGL